MSITNYKAKFGDFSVHHTDDGFNLWNVTLNPEMGSTVLAEPLCLKCGVLHTTSTEVLLGCLTLLLE